jgi:hypothetical protein
MLSLTWHGALLIHNQRYPNQPNITTINQQLVVGDWWLVVGDWWLVVGGWWLVR